MAKQGYRIPDSLDKSQMDRIINFSKNPNSTFGLVSVRTILAYVGAGTLVVVLWRSGLLAGNSFVFNIFYIIAIFYFVSRLVNTTRTGDLAYTQIAALGEYLPEPMRRIVTTRKSSVQAFYKMYGIQSIDEKGIIRFSNNDVGTLLSVDGNGSILLFDEDRNAILDGVDAFWRKIDTGMYCVQITVKEGQKVDLQLGNYQRRWNKVAVNPYMTDAQKNILGDMMDREVDILVNDIAVNYRSIHQYWLLRTKNMEQLKRFQTLVKAEVDGDALVIRHARTQYEDDLIRISRTLFS